MTVRVTMWDDVSGDKQVVELPSDDYVVLACRWSDAVELIAGHLASENGVMRLWKARELAGQAVEALSREPTILLAPKSARL